MIESGEWYNISGDYIVTVDYESGGMVHYTTKNGRMLQMDFEDFRDSFEPLS